MKQAGAKFLRTLTPSDLATVNINGVSLKSNSSELLSEIILNADFSAGQPPSLTEAFQEAFDEFETVTAEREICHNFVVLFSDSSLSVGLEANVRDLHMQSPSVDIFTYTFGGLAVDPTISQSIACSYRGAWFGTGSSPAQPSVDDVVPMYLNLYSAVLPEGGRRVRWMESGDDIITGCVPVYQHKSAAANAPLLMGVACIGLNATSIRLEDDPKVRTENKAPLTTGGFCVVHNVYSYLSKFSYCFTL